MYRSTVRRLALALACALGAWSPVAAAEVAIFTGTTNWITKAAADVQAQICIDRLNAVGIPTVWFSAPTDDLALATWVEDSTNNGELDVLVLYGTFPTSIYAAGNTMPNGSLAELFIESEDGDAIVNHGDWMFYVNLVTNNGAAGLQNMMDVPGITMGPDNTAMVVSAEGRAIAPSLTDYLSDRPLALDQLGGEWIVEASLAQNAAGTRADPVVVRDGPRGRLIPLYQTNAQNDPKGAVAAEVIAWLYGEELVPTQLAIVGPTTAVAGRASRLSVRLADAAGVATPGGAAVTVNLSSDSGTGVFDTSRTGPFDGSITSVVVPAGASSATVFYREASPGAVTVSASAGGFGAAQIAINVFEDLTGVPGEVAVFTGNVGWIDKAAADVQAQFCVDKLAILGIPATLYPNAADDVALAAWMDEVTDNGEVDVLVLYGHFPSTLYPAGNTMIDGSPAELFIESTDGDVIINHADYMFYVSSVINNVAGLQNMMDIPAITMWDDNTPMVVTDDGRAIAPSLSNYLTDRPLHLDELAGDWFVEASLAQNAAGTRADPVIVRDGNRGRLVPAMQASFQNDPKGAVAAEIIAWLHDVELGGPSKVGLLGRAAAYPNRVLQLTAQVQDFSGSPSVVSSATTITLQTSSPTGAFDVVANGPFDGSISSLSIPSGGSSATFFYRDSSPGMPVLRGTAPGLTAGTLSARIFARSFAPPGQVAVFTGTTNWITKPEADVQARVCVESLEGAGVPTVWFAEPDDEVLLSEWVEEATGNGELDVLVLFGYFPPSIYPVGNAMPNGSIAELYIESTDGDVIINHADWMFYVNLVTNNGAAGLQNMMDLPAVTMAGFDNTQMLVTAEGRTIAPNLSDFLTDRPLHLDTLGGDWLVEVSLAESADGTLADPVIVRDGDRGRLIPLFQTNAQNDPKGAVAAEVIAWLLGADLVATRLAISGPSTTVTGTPVRYTVSLQDPGGIPRAFSSDVTVSLSSDSATGVFDTAWSGSFDGSVRSVTIPAGDLSAAVYYRDSAAGLAVLTASTGGSPDLDDAQLQVNVLQDLSGRAGEVAIFTGNVGWIDKPVADAQAQICASRLDGFDISNLWFPEPTDDLVLAEWIEDATDNGAVDVLVLYGYLPSSLYEAGNIAPDGSLVERFIESTDGDVVINHADYMFYVSSVINNVAGLQNIMDIPTITMWGDNTPMVVTEEGSAIAPSLADYLTDRPFHLDELEGEWFVEAALARNAGGNLADPVIVRDGNRGRLVPVLQAAFQDDPKGDVAAEIIAWLLGSSAVGETFVRGDADSSGVINLTDGVVILQFLFNGGRAPLCMDAADTDDSGGNQPAITDAVIIFQWLFNGGRAPAAPTPTGTTYPAANCGADLTEDALDCVLQSATCAG